MTAQRLLLVEDEATTVNVLEIFLAELGFEPLIATRVDEALEIVSGTSVDVVLTDYLLPGSLTGADLAVRLRAQDASLPIAILTGWPTGQVRDALGGAADVHVLGKPLSLSQLRDFLAEHVPGR